MAPAGTYTVEVDAYAAASGWTEPTTGTSSTPGRSAASRWTAAPSSSPAESRHP